MTNPMTSKQLKNRYQYLQKKLQAQISNDPAPMVESPPPQMSSSPPSIPSSPPLVPLSFGSMNTTENVNDRFQSIASSDIPSSSNTFISPKNMPSWELINSNE